MFNRLFGPTTRATTAAAAAARGTSNRTVSPEKTEKIKWKGACNNGLLRMSRAAGAPKLQEVVYDDIRNVLEDITQLIVAKSVLIMRSYNPENPVRKTISREDVLEALRQSDLTVLAAHREGELKACKIYPRPQRPPRNLASKIFLKPSKPINHVEREIAYYSKVSDCLYLPKKPFQRMVRTLVDNNVRFTYDAMGLLQSVVEMHVLKVIADGVSFSRHAKRTLVMGSDINLSISINRQRLGLRKTDAAAKADSARSPDTPLSASPSRRRQGTATPSASAVSNRGATTPAAASAVSNRGATTPAAAATVSAAAGPSWTRAFRGNHSGADVANQGSAARRRFGTDVDAVLADLPATSVRSERSRSRSRGKTPAQSPDDFDAFMNGDMGLNGEADVAALDSPAQKRSRVPRKRTKSPSPANRPAAPPPRRSERLARR
jgi:histone H3/H4